MGGACGIAVAPLGSERRVNVIAERIDRLELLELWYDEDPTGCDVGYGGSNGDCGCRHWPDGPQTLIELSKTTG